MSDTSKAIIDLISKYGNRELAMTLETVFDYSCTAERVIKEMQHKFPKYNRKIWNTFHLLMPTPALRATPIQDLYAKHCEEIIIRIINGITPNPGTKAEMISVLHHTSLNAPLNNDHAWVYAKLFKEVLPDKWDKLGLGVTESTGMYESYPGAGDEIISSMQRKLRVKRDA